MKHGTLGSQDNLTLHFFEWPDLGTYFLFHGVGWGVSWPIALLSIAAIVVTWRRRDTEPALAHDRAAAVLWYAVAEATPLKRGGDVERYVVPCAATPRRARGGMDRRAWASRHDRLAGDASPDRAGAEPCSQRRQASLDLLMVPLAAHPLAHRRNRGRHAAASGALARAHGPAPPYELAFVGDRDYHLDGRPARRGDDDAAAQPRRPTTRSRTLERFDVLAFSELDTRRFKDFPRKSRRQLAAYDRLRADFPVVVISANRSTSRADFTIPTSSCAFAPPRAARRPSEYDDRRGVSEVLDATSKLAFTLMALLAWSPIGGQQDADRAEKPKPNKKRVTATLIDVPATPTPRPPAAPSPTPASAPESSAAAAAPATTVETAPRDDGAPRDATRTPRRALRLPSRNASR